jgi:hypothetical protein
MVLLLMPADAVDVFMGVSVQSAMVADEVSSQWVLQSSMDDWDAVVTSIDVICPKMFDVCVRRNSRSHFPLDGYKGSALLFLRDIQT